MTCFPLLAFSSGPAAKSTASCFDLSSVQIAWPRAAVGANFFVSRFGTKLEPNKSLERHKALSEDVLISLGADKRIDLHLMSLGLLGLSGSLCSPEAAKA